jgi:hypothetical protein
VPATSDRPATSSEYELLAEWHAERAPPATSTSSPVRRWAVVGIVLREVAEAIDAEWGEERTRTETPAGIGGGDERIGQAAARWTIAGKRRREIRNRGPLRDGRLRGRAPTRRCGRRDPQGRDTRAVRTASASSVAIRATVREELERLR